MARHRVARYADEWDTDRAWVLRDLWTGAFDVQVVVPTTERPRGLEHLDPLLGYLQGHVLGRIPEGALVTESISQYPDVLASEGDVRKQADWNLMAFDLGRHTGVLGEMVGGNQIDRIMCSSCG